MTATLLTTLPTGVDAAVAFLGALVIVGLAAVVHRDAARVGLGRPRLWAGIVSGSCTVGLATYLVVPTVPIPGLLVVVLVGPVAYLFEREDVTHDDGPAHPRALPNEPADESSAESADTIEE